MYVLKEFVGRISSQFNRDTTFDKVLFSLRELGIDVEREDRHQGEIVARCWSVVANMFVWRCWSDKLLFDLKDSDDKRTSVKIHAIPNLLKIRVPAGEILRDPDKVLAQVSERIRESGDCS